MQKYIFFIPFICTFTILCDGPVGFSKKTFAIMHEEIRARAQMADELGIEGGIGTLYREWAQDLDKLDELHIYFKKAYAYLEENEQFQVALAHAKEVNTDEAWNAFIKVGTDLAFEYLQNHSDVRLPKDFQYNPENVKEFLLMNAEVDPKNNRVPLRVARYILSALEKLEEQHRASIAS